MSTPIDDGGPAYPVEFFVGECRAQNSTGMTLRDYVAAAVLNGYISLPEPGEPQVLEKWNHKAIARACYMFADAMLAARKK